MLFLILTLWKLALMLVFLDAKIFNDYATKLQLFCNLPYGPMKLLNTKILKSLNTKILR